MDQKERRRYLIEALLDENKKLDTTAVVIPGDEEESKEMLRALMNVRPPSEVPERLLNLQDEYLQEELRSKKVTEFYDTKANTDGLRLYQGDITLIKADSIVNAANSGLTGCYIPNHKCIDNAIFTFAGMQLRTYMGELMDRRGNLPEPVGGATISPGFNLPSAYIIHTVGPMVEGELTDKDRKLLKSCYEACLESAQANELKNIVFCCISTGEFHFPNDEAAKIAVDTVTEYKNSHENTPDVMFNVLKDIDYEIYKGLLF